MKLLQKLTISIAITLTAFSAMAHDTSDSSSKQTTLKNVMKGLLNDSQKISEGIFLEKFKQIEIAAVSIANHPSPSSDIKQKLVGTLGAEMGVFKSFDTKVHNSAVAIGKAAKAQDMNLVVKEYYQLVDGCLACHGSFKKRVSEILE